MFQVQLRFDGDGLWRALLQPVSLQAAQTITGAARKLNLADQVEVEPANVPARPLDLKI